MGAHPGFEDFISPFSSYAGLYAAEEDVPDLMARVPDRGADFLDEYEIK